MSTDTHGSADCKGREPSAKSLLDKWTLINRINGDRELRDSAIRVATYLMWRMNCRWETCWPGRQRIAEDTGLSVRTVGDALRQLRDRKWITWRERKAEDGSSTSSEYRFLWGFDEAGETYVDRQNLPQEPPAEAGEVCQGGQAKPARINKGRLSSETPSQLSTPSASRAGHETSDPVSAEKNQPKGPAAEIAPVEQLQEGSAEWWSIRLWNMTGVEFKAKFYPTISMAAFKKRLGEELRRLKRDIPPLERAMRAAIEAEPGGDAWEYTCAILRERVRKSADYRTPSPVRGVM